MFFTGWGLFVCVLAMLSAGLVEFARLELYKKGQVLPEKLHGTHVVRLSVFWQIPQYLLVGLSEVSPSFCPPIFLLILMTTLCS